MIGRGNSRLFFIASSGIRLMQSIRFFIGEVDSIGIRLEDRPMNLQLETLRSGWLTLGSEVRSNRAQSMGRRGSVFQESAQPPSHPSQYEGRKTHVETEELNHTKESLQA